MDIYTRFNRKSIGDRQVDTLIGLCKGLTADGKVQPEEADFLRGWLIQSRQACDNPIIHNLLQKVDSILEDGVLDADEAIDLFALLRKIAGGQTEVGELAKPASLPVDVPPAEIIFPGRSFLYTGTFVYGSRRQCQAATSALGGVNAKSVNKSLDYLVIGAYVTDSWAHESFGRKIEKAMVARTDGVPLSIVTEEQWISAGELR